MSLPREVKECLNCHREHEFFYGWGRCEASLPHGFILGPDDLSSCKFCGLRQRYPIHDMSGASEIKHCTNCDREHWFTSSWPACDAYQPHGYMSYSGMEGRCQFCGGPPAGFIHNKEHR